MGELNARPTATGEVGYPISGLDGSYSGLCSFACNYGYCPDTACGTTEVALSAPSTASDFPVCIQTGCTLGSGEDNYSGLCSFSCSYGYCPDPCTCQTNGSLVTPPTSNGETGCPVLGLDSTYTGLCAFACEHGYCPDGACQMEPAGTSCTIVTIGTTSPDTDGYLDVSCDYGTLGSDLNDPAQRWIDAQADEAWADALQNYTDYMNEHPQTTFQFAEIIADFFHATSSRLCTDPTNTECDVTIACGQKGGLEVNSPAGSVDNPRL